MTDTNSTTAGAPQYVHFDLNDLDLGQITFLELTVNQKLREFLPDTEIVTFNDIVAQFRTKKDRDTDPDGPNADDPGRVRVPVGIILQTVGLLQLRATNPDATWEDAGKLRVEVEAPKAAFDPTDFITSAERAAQGPEDQLAILQRVAAEPTTPIQPPPLLPSEPSGPLPGTPTASNS